MTGKKELHILISESQLNRINEYKEEHHCPSLTDAIRDLINKGLTVTEATDNLVLARLDKIEKQVNKSAAGSLGSLAALSYVLQDTNLTHDVLADEYLEREEATKRTKAWSNKSCYRIFQFFKNVGDGLKDGQRVEFWRGLAQARKKKEFENMSIEELIGADCAQYEKLLFPESDTSIR